MTKPTDSEHGGAFLGIDFDSFWDDSSYSLDNHVEPPPSDALIASIEAPPMAPAFFEPSAARVRR